jgi:HTH-type transcriptional regulator/antitoxin HigA
MKTLKYFIIKTKTQYQNYCSALEKLATAPSKNKGVRDEIELLTLLIEKWDREQHEFTHPDPIRLLKSLMKDHALKATDLALILKISKGYVSDILHYKKGLSKDSIRTLSSHFKVVQEAFNRPYKLRQTASPKTRKRSSITA